MTCLCISNSAAENLVSMATNICVLLFYTILLELKLVGHLLSNRHEIFMKASLIILLKKSGFHFWISTLDVELCGVKVVHVHCSLQFQSLSPHSSTPEVVIQKWKPLFFSKIIKEALVKISCLLDKRWLTSFNLSKMV